jgi:ferrous iron transport protein B
MWDIAQDKNIEIDVKELEDILTVPVVPVTAISGEGIRELALRIKEASLVKIEKIIEKADN